MRSQMTFYSIKKHYSTEAFILIPSLIITILAYFTNFFETVFQQLVNFKNFVVQTLLSFYRWLGEVITDLGIFADSILTSTKDHFSVSYDGEWNYVILELGICFFFFLFGLFMFVAEYGEKENVADMNVFAWVFMLITAFPLVVSLFVPGFWTWLIVTTVKIILFIIMCIVGLFVHVLSNNK
jgi:hypothetical protein